MRTQRHDVGRCRLKGQKYKWMCALGLLSVALTVLGNVPVAKADCPAVTDFGQRDEVVAWTGHPPGWKQAVFVTLYPDGSSESQIRMVHDDAQDTFVGEHPGWHLDNRLTWFVQMPVYVRELSDDNYHGGTHAV